MEQHTDPGDRGIETSLKATYRALLARGVETGEAANLTAFLHGLPSAGFHWRLAEVEAIIRRRIAHASDQRTAAGLEAPSATQRHFANHADRHPNPNHPSRGTTIHDRRRFKTGSTHVIDPPTP